MTWKAQLGKGAWSSCASASTVLALLCEGQELFWSPERLGLVLLFAFCVCEVGLAQPGCPRVNLSLTLFLLAAPPRLQQSCSTLLLHQGHSRGCLSILSPEQSPVRQVRMFEAFAGELFVGAASRAVCSG